MVSPTPGQPGTCPASGSDPFTSAFTRYPAPRMARLSQVFTGKDRVFFDLFEEAAANVVRGADLLDQMLAHYPDRADLVARHRRSASRRATGSPTTSTSG